MIEVISPLTGSSMWVHESRIDEYVARGCRIVDPKTAAILNGSVSEPDTPPKPKATRKKKTD